MDGHKEGGKFHPHTSHQSAIHSSDVYQNRIKVKKKKLHSGYTIAESWNVTDFQQKQEILNDADVDFDNPFWKKQIDENMYVRWNKIPHKDQIKIGKILIDDDDAQHNEDLERLEMNN